MQSSLRPSLDGAAAQIPWKGRNSRRRLSCQILSLRQGPESNAPRLTKPLRKLTSSNFLKGSCQFQIEELDEDASEEFVLPIVVHQSDRACRYCWDGTCIRLLPGGHPAPEAGGFEDGFRCLFRMSRAAVRKTFVPQQVQENYFGYLKWKFLHRVFSSALHVLATQAMFRAIGFGSSRALSSAAALNWVLKDGLARLSRCIYTATVGSAFDTNLKRVRFSTSVLFSLSIGIELLTPAFPQHFLLLAVIANIAKSISLAAYIATGSAIHRSFAVVDNLGEVSAKAQIQTVCFDNLGLLLAALLNVVWKSNNRLMTGLPLLIYPIFATIDLFSIYQALQHVHLQTLTKSRLEIIIDKWIQGGFVPSLAEVSIQEGIFPRLIGSKLWPIRIGGIDTRNISPKSLLMTMRSLRREDLYFICIETFHTGLLRKPEGISVSFHERACATDIIMGLLQACHARQSLLRSRMGWERILDTRDSYGTIPRDWLSVLEDSKRNAQREVNLFMEELRKAGWEIKNILLSTQEQIRYSYVD